MDHAFPINDFEDLEACALQNRQPRHHGPYRIKVNAEHVFLEHPVVTARQVLDAAALLPADEYVLLMFRRDGMLANENLDDEIDLRHHCPRRFLAFHSDRIVYFELDGRRFPWGADTIPEAELRELSGIPQNYGIWLERKGEEDLPIARGSTVSLAGPHIHRFYTGIEQTTAGRGLPERDVEYLTEKGHNTQLVDQGGLKGLLISGYQLPSGKFDAASADVLVLLPAGYPDVGPDMFYTLPWLKVRTSGQYAQAANVPYPFGGQNFQRWSRHCTDWRPGIDGIRTVLRRIEAALRDA